MGSVLNQSGIFSWEFHRAAAALILEIQHWDVPLFYIPGEGPRFSVSFDVQCCGVWISLVLDPSPLCLMIFGEGNLRCLQKASPWGERKGNTPKTRKSGVDFSLSQDHPLSSLPLRLH